MKIQTTRSNRSELLRSTKATFMTGLLAALVLMFSLQTSQAGSATWKAHPVDGNWNNASNWTPPTVPNSSSDTATFGVSSVTSVSISTNTQVTQLIFNPGASAYTISTADAVLTISGTGITNNSGLVQNLGSADSIFYFYNTVGDQIDVTGTFYSYGNVGAGYFTIPSHTASSFYFYPASAGSGTFDVFGTLAFNYTSTADQGTFTVHHGADSTSQGNLAFSVGATAANATITVEGASTADPNTEGLVGFGDETTGGSATIVAQGGTNGGEGAHVTFNSRATGDNASITLLGNSQLNVSEHYTSPQPAVGSLAGTGTVFLGQFNLTIGGNSLGTVFSGLIQDGGSGGGTGGAITKIGNGVLTLTGANTYTGSTSIARGVLLVNNRTGSGTGTGIVRVQAGTLGGRGIINGQVIVGDTRSQKATLAPSVGMNKPTRLTINSGFSFASDGTYNCKVNTKTAGADQVAGTNLTIDPAAQFALTSIGNVALPAGAVFTIVNNTGALQIAGRFSNLADGATITSGPNTFQANYEGGDGNDLTLTVVP